MSHDPRLYPPGTPILNLGCGDKTVVGAVNHDRIKHRPEVDVVHDLNVLPWPWEDEAFELIIASAVLEHLRLTLVEALDECWRLLRPGGKVRVKVPHWQADSSHADPTHRWFYSLQTFDFFDPCTRFGSQFGFYTPCKWEITKPARLNPAGVSILCTLRKVKA